MRKPAPRGARPRIAQVKAVPAPSGGLIANQNLAAPDRRPGAPQGAAMLENWFPTATGCRVRGGSQKYATIGAATETVKSVFGYSDGTNRRLFAADSVAIYDISTIIDPSVSPAVAVGSLTNGLWSTVQFATPGGTFLRAVNGFDTSQVFDGSTWSTTPAITGVSSDTLNSIWAFKTRIFFTQKESLDAYYLGANEIGGAASAFPLGGVFSRGGSLLFGSSWSLSENSGLSASCVFVTTEGEVAVYQGTDPSTADTWGLVGVYRIGRPLGKKAFIRAGGDLIIATDIGFIPLSQAIQRDVAALGPAAVSYPIEEVWNREVASRIGDWQCEVWPTAQMVMVAPPPTQGQDPIMLVANARTGAWAIFTGWSATALEVYGDRAFFGSSLGRVIEAEVSGADDGAPYTASCVPLFDDLKTPASLKVAPMARAVLLAAEQPEERLSIQSDYAIGLPTVPSAGSVAVSSLWGTGIWGSSVWGQTRTQRIFQQWRSVSGRGYALAPGIQITSGSVASPLIDLVRLDYTVEAGDIVT